MVTELKPLSVRTKNFMTERQRIFGFALFSGVIVLASPALAALPGASLAVGSTWLAGHHTPMWLEVEKRMGRK